MLLVIAIVNCLQLTVKRVSYLFNFRSHS